MILNQENTVCFFPRAASLVPGFQLSSTAASLLIVTQSKRGQSKGGMTCLGKCTCCLISYTHTHIHMLNFLHSSTDALETLRSMLSAGQVPMQLAVTRLVQALGKDGNLAGIQAVESKIKDLGLTHNLSSMVFINNTALAHIKK